MKIKTLTLQNFKGIKELTLNFNGNNAIIYGDNATGKTTIYDAYIWLLFGKDSLNKANFGIKTIKKNGEEIHNLQHTVEAEFIDPDIKLKRIHSEKYTKKRGHPIPELDGHSTEYLINDITVKGIEYEHKIASIIDEDLFKILSNPLFFNSVVEWEKRRSILLKLCNDISDSTIISNNPELKDIFSIGLSMQDFEKYIDQKIKETTKAMENIPVRINEKNKDIVDVIDLSLEQLEDSKRQIIEHKQNHIKEYTQNPIAKFNDKLIEIKNQILKYMNDCNTKQMNENLKNKLTNDKLLDKIQLINKDIINISIDIQKKIEINEVLENEVQQLRAQFKTEADDTFKHIIEDYCSVCKQKLSEEQIKEINNEALKKFMAEKTKKIEEIKMLGKTKKEEIEKNNIIIQRLQKENNALQAEVSKMETQYRNINDNAMQNFTYDFEKDTEYKTLMQKKDDIEQKIVALKQDKTTLEQFQDIITAFDKNIGEIEDNITKIKNNDNVYARITELKDDEKKLAGLFNEYSKQKNLCKIFTRIKIETITNEINEKFKFTKFLMFKQLINKEIQECCIATFENIPCPDLNKAQTINTGLDIINTLSKHYKINVPIFIDNAESVTEINRIDAQMILLKVSENDKTLRMCYSD